MFTVCSRSTDNTVPGISGHFSTFSKGEQLARDVAFGDVFVSRSGERQPASQPASVAFIIKAETNGNDTSRHGGCFPNATSTDNCVASCWRRWQTVSTFLNCYPNANAICQQEVISNFEKIKSQVLRARLEFRGRRGFLFVFCHHIEAKIVNL